MTNLDLVHQSNRILTIRVLIVTNSEKEQNRYITKAIVVIVHLVQRCDSDMDFEALLIHTRQEVALDLKSFMFSIFQFVKHFAPTF